ncbi:MFS transporter [Streptomyces sp. NPDC014006]|uniref:MFS transporter n=1 Tax=Streptomyces sp. NPDC014006 TaxID=3364870 RepID=UPI0036F61B5D
MTSAEAKSADTTDRVLPRGPGAVRFGTAGFVNAVGTGFFYPFSLLFFTALSGESLATVGMVLTVTTLGALPGLFVVGRLVDRLGPRLVLIGAAVVRAVCFVGFVSLPGLLPLAVFSVVLALGNRAEQAAGPLLAVRLAPEGQRSRWLALSRVTFNAGMGTGALLAGLFVAGTGSGFVLLGALNAASFVVTAVLYLGIPAGAPAAPAPARRHAEDRRARPWQNVTYLRVAGANALLWTAALAVESALPVFALEELALPSWTVGVLFAVNTALLTALQLPMSRTIDRLRPGPVMALGGLAYVALYASALLAASAPSWTRLAVLVAGMVVYTLGEMAVSQAALVMLTGLPPERNQGSYLAFNQLLVGVATALAPLLATGLLSTVPTALWWALTGLSVLAALLPLRTPRP